MPENVAKVREMIREDRRRTIQDVCNILVLSYGTCQHILSDELNMRRIAAKFVPRLLTDDQKQHRLEVSMELKEQVRNDPDFLSKVVPGDEVGFMGTTLKENSNHPSGSVYLHPSRRKRGK
jgi:hypothetical protein